MMQWLYTYVSSVCSKYFICIRHMLQVFSSGCCKKRMFQVFQVFNTQVFHLDVEYVCNGFQIFSRCSSVSDAYFKYFVCLLLYVTSVTSGYLKNRSGVAHRMHLALEVAGSAGPLVRCSSKSQSLIIFSS
jgi:hypothetical protein